MIHCLMYPFSLLAGSLCIKIIHDELRYRRTASLNTEVGGIQTGKRVARQQNLVIAGVFDKLASTIKQDIIGI